MKAQFKKGGKQSADAILAPVNLHSDVAAFDFQGPLEGGRCFRILYPGNVPKLSPEFKTFVNGQ